jgi:GNAT superfamily N-acetyltransferase
MAADDIRVRRVAPGDAAELERFYACLSADSRVLRFHCASRGIGHAQAQDFAAADHQRRDGFVAVAGERIVGHLVLEPLGEETEELAVAVDDRLQHQGVGTLLLVAAVASARLRGVRRLVAWVRAENTMMLHLLAASHYPLRVTWEGSVARYELAVPLHSARRTAVTRAAGTDDAPMHTLRRVDVTNGGLGDDGWHLSPYGCGSNVGA